MQPAPIFVSAMFDDGLRYQIAIDRDGLIYQSTPLHLWKTCGKTHILFHKVIILN
ncbi:hypothetical protein KBT16_08540 [Nostoc sp. CCCryo 231-06]|nr:hypothetical protein [Nostoc sp. CCCryo 231-06]